MAARSLEHWNVLCRAPCAPEVSALDRFRGRCRAGPPASSISGSCATTIGIGRLRSYEPIAFRRPISKLKRIPVMSRHFPAPSWPGRFEPADDEELA